MIVHSLSDTTDYVLIYAKERRVGQSDCVGRNKLLCYSE